MGDPQSGDYGVHLGLKAHLGQVEEFVGMEEGNVVQQGSGCVSANNKSKKQLGSVL